MEEKNVVNEKTLDYSVKHNQQSFKMQFKIYNNGQF